MALETRRALTHEELEALYARLNELIDHARKMQRSVSKAIDGSRRPTPPRVASPRPHTQARGSGRTAKSRS
jgi:hypothetical protein